MQQITLPEIVDYPEFYNFKDHKHIFDKKFCYIIEPYNVSNGLSLYIGFREEFILTRIGDFSGNLIDISSSKDQAVRKLLGYHVAIANVLKATKIRDCLMFFSKDKGELILVDVMLSANKYMGPGMLRDLFSKTIPSQKIIAVKIVDDSVVSENKGKYLKPSRFQYCLEDKTIRPLYGIIDL